MATIVILEHAMQRNGGMPYMVYVFAERWMADGHKVLVHYGTHKPPPADIAFLNVDVTVTPLDYRALVQRYPQVINGRVFDISKRGYSQLLLSRDAAWDGPVIVKTDANFGGFLDQTLREREQQQGLSLSIPAGPVVRQYPVYGSVREVPAEIWSNPQLIVERFIPERSAEGYHLRMWTFLGKRERCSRYCSPDPMVKAASVTRREESEVPGELREWRARLGFEFGKFDFVFSEGRYWLLDANRTPALPPDLLARPGMREAYHAMGAGLYDFLA